MSGDLKIIGEVLPNIPWQERPEGCRDVIWRYDQNPVIPRDLIPCSNSIFNSAVVPYKGEFRGVFRVDNKAREMRIHAGQSKDGINWTIEHEPIQFNCDDPEIGRFVYGYDRRSAGLRTGTTLPGATGTTDRPLAWPTYDFQEFYQLENAYLPFNRNGVLFPRKINGRYAMLSRPSDNGHTPFGDIFYSESPDMVYWGKHRHVMCPADGWQSTKIGAGPIPIETSEGWVMIYHGVLTSCNGFVYSVGAALLDHDEPWKVIARTRPYILSPQTLYECVGDVPNVVFPCAALVDSATGRMAMYYGGADTVTGLAFGYVQELVEFIKENSLV